MVENYAAHMLLAIFIQLEAVTCDCGRTAFEQRLRLRGQSCHGLLIILVDELAHLISQCLVDQCQVHVLNNTHAAFPAECDVELVV